MQHLSHWQYFHSLYPHLSPLLSLTLSDSQIAQYYEHLDTMNMSFLSLYHIVANRARLAIEFEIHDLLGLLRNFSSVILNQFSFFGRVRALDKSNSPSSHRRLDVSVRLGRLHLKRWNLSRRTESFLHPDPDLYYHTRHLDRCLRGNNRSRQFSSALPTRPMVFDNSDTMCMPSLWLSIFGNHET